MGNIDVFNVMDFGATGDGSTPDNKPIQDALDFAESSNGGVVYLPPGTYLIQETLKLPNKVYMKGVGGTTFGTASKDIGSAPPEAFLTQVITTIKLDNYINMDMITQKGDPDTQNYNFYQSGIENIVFYGNKEYQSSGNGISILDAIDKDHANRGQCRFNNILLYRIKGTGFYGGMYQHELFLNEIMCIGCDGNGFELYGQDLKLTRVGSGINGGIGFKISGGGGGRYFDIDSWGNEIGIEIFDTYNIFFFHLQCDLNKKYGLYIHPITWTPSQIQIFRGTFSENSRYDGPPNGGPFPDVMITSVSPNQGPASIAFIGCIFRGSCKNKNQVMQFMIILIYQRGILFLILYSYRKIM